MRALRPMVAAGLALWAAGIAVLTLIPSGYAEPLSIRSFLCFGCTTRFGADAILNLLLFLPAGVLVRAGWSTRAALLFGFAATAGIETLQIWVPGRYPTLSDLLLNTAGAGLGALLVAAIPNRRLAVAGGVLSAALWLAPVVLLLPHPTGAPLYGQWTPELQTYATYRGSVIDARIDGALARLELDDSRRAREALAGRDPVDVTFETATPPERLAPVFSVFDANREMNLLIGVVGHDVVVRERTLASSLGLDRPDTRWNGALAESKVADAVTLRRHPPGGPGCLEVDGRRRCDVTPTLAEGWAFLLNLEGGGRSVPRLLSLLWALGIACALGVGAGTPRRAGLIAVFVVAAGAGLGHLSPDVRAPVLESVIVVLAATLAGTAPKRFSRRRR